MIADTILDAFVEAACVPTGPGVGSHGDGDLGDAEKILMDHPGIASANLYTASILGEGEMVKELLAENPGLATQKMGARCWDALTYLCFSRYLRLDKNRSAGFEMAAKALLGAGADANTGFHEKGDYPDWEPVLYGAAGVAFHAGVTKLLLEHGADPNEGEVYYHSPETWTNDAMIELIASGKLTQDSLCCMLLRKADFHDHDGMKLLLDGGADPNRITIWKFTALHQALRRDNHLKNIELLLDYGADPLLPNTKEGHTSLDIAVFRGRKDVLDSLIARGTKIELQGLGKLVFACAMNDASEIQRITTAEPGLVQQLQQYGGMLLSMFAGTSNADGVACLLDLGVPVTALYSGDPYYSIPPNSTALHVAAWKGWPEVVRLLIDRGAPVNIVDGRGKTPLMLAIRACVNSYWTNRRNTLSIEALLEAGTSVEGIKIPCGYDDADEILMRYIT